MCWYAPDTTQWSIIWLHQLCNYSNGVLPFWHRFPCPSEVRTPSKLSNHQQQTDKLRKFCAKMISIYFSCKAHFKIVESVFSNNTGEFNCHSYEISWRGFVSSWHFSVLPMLLVFNRQINGTSSKAICSHLCPGLLPTVSKQQAQENTKNMLTRGDCLHSLWTKKEKKKKTKNSRRIRRKKNLFSPPTNPLESDPPSSFLLDHLLLVKRTQPWTERGWWYP